MTAPMRGAPNATSRPPGRKASAVSSALQPSVPCRYRVAANWKPTYAPNRHIAPRFARTSEPLRKMPRRTSGCGVWRSTMTKAASTTQGEEALPHALFHQGVDEHEHARGEQDGAWEVVLALGTEVRAVLGDVARDQEEQDRRDGHGEQERQAPVGARQQAAEHEAEGEAARAERVEDRERLVAPGTFGERGGDQGERGGDGERRGGALDEARGDQQRAGRRRVRRRARRP